MIRKLGLIAALVCLLLVAERLPFLPETDRDVQGRSIVEEESAKKQARERATGEERPGQVPPEAIQGSHSGTTVGRPENLWGTKGKPLHGDELQ